MKSNLPTPAFSILIATALGITMAMYADKQDVDESSEIEELVVEEQQTHVRYTHLVNSVEMFATPIDVLKPVSSLAFDNSIGQIRSRGSEANHLGIRIDGYDIADPVSDFNFATLSCVGIDVLHFSPTPGSGSIGGVLNLESTSAARRNVNVAFGSAGNQIQFDYGDNQHNLSLSRKEWEGIDILNDGDLDGIQHFLGHYHFAGSNWQSTLRYATIEQGYDRGRAEIDQGLVGVTGVLWDSLRVRFSTTLNRAVWYESFNNNTTGRRTKLSLSTPFGKWFTWELDQVYDVNESSVRGEPTRKPIAVNYLRGIYDQHYQKLSWHASVTRTATSQDEPILSKSVRIAWNTRSEWIPNAQLAVYAEFDHQTIALPSMVDRYGWGQRWLPNPDVKPERGTSLSVGAKLVNAATTFQVTRFSARLRDKISFGRNVSENIDYGRNRGIELLWRQIWNSRITTDVAYSFINSEARSDLSTPYQQTQRRPQNILAGVLSYSAANLRSQLTMRWVDKALDACWRGCVTLDAHLVVDSVLTYRWNNSLETSLNVYNLLDETYFQVYRYNTPGRQFTLGISLLLGN